MKRLQQDEESDEEKTTKTDETFDKINAFLQGFKSDNILPSAMACSNNLRKTVKFFNETTAGWENMTEGLAEAYVFDTSSWISYQLAPSSRYCF